MVVIGHRPPAGFGNAVGFHITDFHILKHINTWFRLGREQKKIQALPVGKKAGLGFLEWLGVSNPY